MPDPQTPLEIAPPLPTSVARLLIVGGSFDPPHRTHLNIAKRAMKMRYCDHVLFVPSGQSAPLKDGAHSSADDRLAMLKMAVADSFGKGPNTAASITTFELHQTRTTYTIDTIHALRKQLPASVKLCLMIGSDQALQFRQWKDWEELLDLVEPVVIPRPPHDFESLQMCTACQLDERLGNAVLDVPVDDVSSTMIRDLIAQGKDAGRYLDPQVAQYIESHHLYESTKKSSKRSSRR